jgi:uncharacterized BrkB/YihY/UPF0761 family membrane protein
LIAGPLVLAASFSLVAYFMIMIMIKTLGVDAFAGALGHVTHLIPVLILILNFSTFYKVVPNRWVQWRDAVTGG